MPAPTFQNRLGIADGISHAGRNYNAIDLCAGGSRLYQLLQSSVGGNYYYRMLLYDYSGNRVTQSDFDLLNNTTHLIQAIKYYEDKLFWIEKTGSTAWQLVISSLTGTQESTLSLTQNSGKGLGQTDQYVLGFVPTPTEIIIAYTDHSDDQIRFNPYNRSTGQASATEVVQNISARETSFISFSRRKGGGYYYAGFPPKQTANARDSNFAHVSADNLTPSSTDLGRNITPDIKEVVYVEPTESLLVWSNVDIPNSQLENLGVYEAALSGIPAPPQTFTVAAHDGYVILNWTLPADNGGSAVTIPEIQRVGPDNIPTNWYSFGFNANTRSYQWNGLPNGTEQRFRVRWVNANGRSRFAEVRATPATVPSAPRNPVASVQQTSVTLTVDAPSSNGGAAITDYEFRYKLATAQNWNAWVSGGLDRTHTFTGLTRDTHYDFQIRAVNPQGNSPVVTISATPQSSANRIVVSDDTNDQLLYVNADTKVQVATENITLGAGAYWGPAFYAEGINRIIYVDNASDDIAYVLDAATRAAPNPSENIDLPNALYSLSCFATDDRLVFVNYSSGEVFIYDINTRAVLTPTENFSIPNATSRISAATWTDDYYVFVDNSSNQIRVHRRDNRNRVTSLEISLGSGNYEDMTATDDRIYILDTSGRRILVLNKATLAAISAETIPNTVVPTGTYRSITATTDRLVLVDRGNRRLQFIRISDRMHVSSETLNISGSGTLQDSFYVAAAGPPVFRQPTTPIVIDDNGTRTVDLSTQTTGAMSYALRSGNESYVTINTTTGVLTITAPDLNADTPITILASATNSAGTTNITLVVTIRNVITAPSWSTIPAQNINEHTPWSLNLATHITGDVDSYSIGTITGTPTITPHITGSVIHFDQAPAIASGTSAYTIPVTATNAGGSVTTNITLNIAHVLQPPTFTQPSAQSVNEGEHYSLNLNTLISNPSGQTLTITPRANNYSNASLLSGMVSFNAPEVTADTVVNLRYRIANADGHIDIDVPVTIRNVPKLPVFTAPSAQSVNENTPYTIDVSTLFTEATSYSERNTESYVSINSTTGVLTVNAPMVNADTVLNLLVTGTNSVGSTNGTILLTIRNVSQLPVFTAPSPQSVNENESITIDLSTLYTGADSYGLRSPVPTGVTLSGSVITIAAPEVASDTVINVLVSGSNIDGKTDATIPVTINHIPQLPVYTAPSAQSVNEGSPYSLNLSTVLTNFQSTSLRDNNERYVVLNNNVVSFPAQTVAADTTIMLLLRATNPDGHTDFAISVTIRNVPAPGFTAPSAQMVNEGEIYRLDLSTVFSNADSYSERNTESYVSVSNNILMVNAPSVGMTTVLNLLVTGMNVGGSTNGTIPLTIRNVEDPPRFTPQPPQVVSPGSMLNLDVKPFFINATSIAFQQGFDEPDWITLTNGVLTGTVPSMGGIYQIFLTGIRGNQSVHATITINARASVTPASNPLFISFDDSQFANFFATHGKTTKVSRLNENTGTLNEIQSCVSIVYPNTQLSPQSRGGNVLEGSGLQVSRERYIAFFKDNAQPILTGDVILQQGELTELHVNQIYEVGNIVWGYLDPERLS